jgi:hypothetical protein
MSTGSSGCGGGETLIFTCAGAAYSGQVANRSGVQLMEQGAGNLFCVAAVAAGIAPKTQPAQPNMINDAKKVVDAVRQRLGAGGGPDRCCCG